MGIRKNFLQKTVRNGKIYYSGFFIFAVKMKLFASVVRIIFIGANIFLTEFVWEANGNIY